MTPRTEDSATAIARFDDKANRASRWYGRGDKLLVSSELLSAHSLLFKNSSAEQITNLPRDAVDFKVFGVVNMLRAMALECFFKCLWLTGGRKIAEGGRYRRIPGARDHDLSALADKVSTLHGISFSTAERDMLTRLSLMIARGRYPIQVSWEISRHRHLSDGRFGSPQYWNSRDDETLFSAVVEKVKKTLSMKVVL